MKKILISIEDLRKILSEVFKDHITQLQQPNSKDTKSVSLRNKLISLQEMSVACKVSLVTVYKWRKAGILPKEIKLGGRVYFNQEEVENLFK